MGTNTLNLQDADDVIVITIEKTGEVKVQTSVDSKADFFEILNIAADMADEYYPQEGVDNLH